jgi:hypothetical protein
LNRQLDRLTAKKLSLAELIEKNAFLVSNRECIETGARNFLKLWSRLNENLTQKFRNLQNTDDLSKNSDDELMRLPVSYLLPSSYGDGFYIYGLVKYLINTQNEFLTLYFNFKNIDKNVANSQQVDLDSLTDNVCINVSNKKGVQRIIYLNSNYTLEYAKELNLEFDYRKIQEAIEATFLSEKFFIKKSVKKTLKIISFCKKELF